MRSSSPTEHGRIELRRARALLGTLVDIRASANWSAAMLNAAISAAFEAVERVQRLMSFHDQHSELSRLNREAAHRPVGVSAATYAVLDAALQFANASDGAFDPCVASVLQSWGYLPAMRVATSSDCPGMRRASFRDVQLLPGHAVCFRRPLQLDLGGIAKGFAVDRAIDALARAGVSSALVNAGGDLRAFGDQPYAVVIRHPTLPSRVTHRLALQDAALATSAITYSSRVAMGYATSALIDPHDDTPCLRPDSVSVRARDAMTADAMTKVVLFADPAVAERLLTAHDACALVHSDISAATTAASPGADVPTKRASRAPQHQRARRSSG